MNENWIEVRVQAKITESKGIKKIYIFYENKMQIFFFFWKKEFFQTFYNKNLDCIASAQGQWTR